MKKGRIYFLAGVCLLFLPSLILAYDPPQADKTFYGDADGDQSLGASDMPEHEKAATGLTAAYSTLQPDNAQQRANTCDIDGDNSCSPSDVPTLELVAAMVQMPIVFPIWEIVNLDLPASADAGTWIPFRLSVRADNLGWKGRPGMNVKVEITSGTGSLSGRHCDPDLAGAPDQLNTEAGASGPNDQCALAVTISDWDGDYGA